MPWSVGMQNFIVRAFTVRENSDGINQEALPRRRTACNRFALLAQARGRAGKLRVAFADISHRREATSAPSCFVGMGVPRAIV